MRVTASAMADSIRVSVSRGTVLIRFSIAQENWKKQVPLWPPTATFAVWVNRGLARSRKEATFRNPPRNVMHVRLTTSGHRLDHLAELFKQLANLRFRHDQGRRHRKRASDRKHRQVVIWESAFEPP